MITFDISGSGGGTITGPDGSVLCSRDDSLGDALPANLESSSGEVVQPDTICTVSVPANYSGGFTVQGEADVASEIDGEDPDGFYLPANDQGITGNACGNPEGGSTAPYFTTTAPCILAGNVTETVDLTFKQTTFAGPLVVAGCQGYKGSVTLRLGYGPAQYQGGPTQLSIMGYADLGAYCGQYTWIYPIANPPNDQATVLQGPESPANLGNQEGPEGTFPLPTASPPAGTIDANGTYFTCDSGIGNCSLIPLITYSLGTFSIPGTFNIAWYAEDVNISQVGNSSFTLDRVESSQDQ